MWLAAGREPRESLMKRRLLIIAICLLLGAVVNVAVAWGCAIFAEWTPPLSHTDADEPQWPRNVPAHWPPVRNDLEGTAFGFHVHRSTGRRIHEDEKGTVRGAEAYLIDVYRVGWPSFAFQWDSWVELEMSRGSGSTNRFDGHPPYTAWHVGLKPPDFLISGPNNQWKRLPIRPTTWLAIATNTLFYATLLWLLIPGSFVLRWFLRLRRGLCTKCAYPMGESSVCTECGKPLAKRAVG